MSEQVSKPGHAGFVHLRVHSAYSLAEGAIGVKDLVGLAAKHAMPAVAITDTNNCFGAMEFSGAAKAKGVQPIIGAQLSVAREDIDPSRPNTMVEPDQLVVLAQSEQGWRNLMVLLSRAYLGGEPGDRPQVHLATVAHCAEGLICLTGGPKGGLGRLLGQDQTEAAEAYLGRLKAMFPDRLYIELMRHGLAEEDRIEASLIDLAYAHDLPLVATNECFFADIDMFEAHDALLCIAEGVALVEPERRHLTREHRFKSAEEMRALFADLPEAVDNTLVIARRCAIAPKRIKPLLPVYTKLNGRSEAEALGDLGRAGLEVRLKSQVWTPDMDEARRQEVATPYRERLDYELGVIAQMGFPGYFLIVADFIQWAKGQGIPVGPGRGSGAGSVVAWALTITDLDPLRFGLLFERFLNPERVSMPDFDIDFCQDRRDEVIRYVQNEYGHDRVAQIITFGKLQARAVLRDVGRVMGMGFGQTDRICKLVPNNPANPVTLQQAIDGEPILQQMIREDEQVSELVDRARKLEGLYRHASTHAAGVVIGDRPLDELVPLYRDPRSDMPVTQYNMKFVEDAGLVKFDFLGLKTLTVIKTALDLIAANPAKGERIDITTLPLDDKATYQMLCRADATGVFQLESSGMRDVLRKLRPDRLEDIIAVVALYRPGPMENIPTYIKRKHAEEPVTYLHASLEPVLKETFGIPIYQEQVMQMAQVLAGYTLGGADLLRRAMGKKIKAEMDDQRATFVKGAADHSNVSTELANQIFDQIAAFAGYGFNKSHAAAYALVAYQTAWLKANHPVEFLAASMTLDMHNTDKLAIFKGELERQRIKLLPPDVNRSEASFTVEDGAVRYALAAIKGVGAEAMRALVETRRSGGPFKDVFDFVERVDPRTLNKKILENLTKAGAFDGLNPNRQQVFTSLELLMRHGQIVQEERTSAQVGLFGEAASQANRPALAAVPDWSASDRLKQEHQAIGFYLSAHPLAAYARTLGKLGVVSFADVLGGRVRQNPVRLAGIVGARRYTQTARGSRMAFVQLSDASGAYEVTVFSEVLATARDLIESGEPVLVTVGVDKRGAAEEGGDLRLTVSAMSALESEAAEAADGMRIHLATASALSPLAGLLNAHARPPAGKRARGLVVLAFESGEGDEVEMELPQPYMVTADIRRAVKGLPGVRDVEDL